MDINNRVENLKNLKTICYIFGVISVTLPTIIAPAIGDSILGVVFSFFYTGIFIYIMLKFKESLNKRLNSIKLDRVILLIVYFSIVGYSLNILGYRDPEGILPYQAIFGLGVLILYIIFGIMLRDIDAPLEKIEGVKSIRTYSNVILLASVMALSIVGIVFYIYLMGFSYFILGNIFKEIEGIEYDIET